MSYLNFVEYYYRDKTRKTRFWEVKNTQGLMLGTVKFYPHWRKYVFEVAADIRPIFDVGCLGEIGAFLTEKTAEWRASL